MFLRSVWQRAKQTMLWPCLTQLGLPLKTIQFLKDNKKLDKSILLHVVKEITKFDEHKCNIVINRALELTQKRLEKGSKYAPENFKKAQIINPLNDHDLVEAIENELVSSEFDFKKRSVEEKIKLHANNDQNKKLRLLLSKMMNHLSIVNA